VNAHPPATPRPGLARRLATNTLHSTTGRFASLLVWMILTPPILHTLGTQGFAVWSLFFAVFGYFNALDFGLAWGTVKHVAAARERGEEGSGGAFATLAVLGYLLLSALWLLLTLLFRDTLLDWLRIPEAVRGVTGFVMVAGAAVFACSGLANVTMAALQGCGRFDLANQVSLVVVIQQAIGIPVVLRAGWGLQGLVVNVGMGWALGFALGLWQLRRAEPGFHWENPRESASHLREAVRFGGPMQATNLFAVLHSQLDKFLLARFVSLAAVTPYELGYRVVAAAAAPAQLLVVAVLPAAAALHAAESHGRLLELHARSRRYVLAVGVATMAAALGSASRLYTVWLGPGHPDAAFALRGLALAMGVTFTTNVGAIVARGVGRTDLEAWFGVVVLVIHLGLSLALIPIYGLTGALIAILAANVIGAAFFLWLLASRLGWARAPLLLEPLGIPLLALVTGAAVSLALDGLFPVMSGPAGWVALALVAAAGAAAAVAVIFATGYVHWQEVRAILFRRGESEA
jgi:O-antigen/teichoic acid export membrane protein